jgi:hypothetical protein
MSYPVVEFCLSVREKRAVEETYAKGKVEV